MNSDRSCVFCRIVAGQEPASVVYQDDRIMAFMTLNPTRPGEFTLIPKAHIDEFCDLPDDLARHVITRAQHLSRSLRRHFRPQRVGLVVHGYGVPHAHLIVVPQHDPTDIVSGRHVRIEDGALRFGVSHLPTPDREELDRQAGLIGGLPDTDAEGDGSGDAARLDPAHGRPSEPLAASRRSLTLDVLPGRLAICRLPAASEVPRWASPGPDAPELFSLTRTPDELSIVAPETRIPADVVCVRGWRALRVAGPLDFALTGILASIAEPLARADVSLFALSTHDTDYVLVKESGLDAAVATLAAAGHRVKPM